MPRFVRHSNRVVSQEPIHVINMTQILELISNIVGNREEEDKSEPMTVLEQLEQENSKNVTERHQLTAEREYEQSGYIPQYGKQLATSVVINAGITYGLLMAIDGLTLSFNPILFYLLCGGVNTIGSVAAVDLGRSPRANLMLGGAKFVINMSINGSLIAQMHHKVDTSRAVVTSIQQEIENYESGYKQQSNDYWVIVFAVLAFLLIIFVPTGIRGKG